jgi:PAS domain S-box-containing protein
VELLARNLLSQLTDLSPSSKLWAKYEGQSSTSCTATVPHFEAFEAGIVAPILNSLSEGLILTDLSGKLKVFNKAAVRFLGGDVVELGSPEWIDKCGFYHPDSGARFSSEDCPSRRALRGEEVEEVEVLLKTPAHPEGIILEINAHPIRDETGKIFGTISLLKDISKRKAQEEQLKYSKVRFETLAYLLNDVVWEWDVMKNVTRRHGVRTALGYPDEVVHEGQKWWMEKIHPEDFPRVQRVFDRVMTQGEDSWREEYRFRKADGSYAYVMDHGRVISKDDNGKPTYLLGAMLDISQRKIAEEKLAQFATIVKSTDDAVVSIDLSGKILSWNDGAEKLWGYSAGEMIGQTAERLMPVDFERVHTNAIEKIKRGESIQRDEVWALRKNGGKMLMSSTVSPVRNEKGEIIGLCAISRDITEVKAAEEKIKHLAGNLGRSNEDLKQFAYIASHDLREPLRTVASFAKLLERDHRQLLNSRASEYIQLMVGGVDRMKRLIDSLLEYSKVEQFPLKKDSVDCMRLMEEIKANLKVALQEANAKLEVEALPTIEGDQILLSQLLQNLVSNSIKFRNGKPPKIVVAANVIQSEWVFSVKDDGIGIEDRFKDRIFQIFQRLHGPNEYPGTGLGLAICKKIVERHGGRIWFESVPGQGTTFYFSVPGHQRPQASHQLT